MEGPQLEDAVLGEYVDILPGGFLLGHELVGDIVVVIVDELEDVIEFVQVHL